MTKQEAKEKFRYEMTIRMDILRNVSINYSYTKHLYTNFSSTTVSTYWDHIRYNLFYVLIIDLAKLFVDNDNQKFNFFKFLIKLEKGDYKKLGVAQSTIDHYRKKLNVYSPFFKSVEKYRNKTFAHTDKLTGISPKRAFFIQLEDIINLGFKMANETSKTILNTEIVNTINCTDLSDLIIS